MKLDGEAPLLGPRAGAHPRRHDDAGSVPRLARGKKFVIAQRQVARQAIADGDASPVFEDESSAVGPRERRPCADHADRRCGLRLAGRVGMLQRAPTISSGASGGISCQRYSASAEGSTMSIDGRFTGGGAIPQSRNRKRKAPAVGGARHYPLPAPKPARARPVRLCRKTAYQPEAPARETRRQRPSLALRASIRPSERVLRQSLVQNRRQVLLRRGDRARC